MDINELEIDIVIIAISLAFLYGLSPIAYKLIIINNNISFDIYLILSSILLLIFSLLYSIIFNRRFNLMKEVNNINPLTVFYFSLYIFFVVFISQLLFHIAIEKTTKLTIFTMITSLYPIITILLSFLVYNKKISMKILLGFMTCLLGLFIILR
jgi:drug/metabolite transporter (DMT)-like permease